MVAGASLPVTFRALSDDEEHSAHHMRVVVGRACVCTGVRGEQCGVGGLLPPCLPWGKRLHRQGAGLGAGTTASLEHADVSLSGPLGFLEPCPIEGTDLSTNLRGKRRLDKEKRREGPGHPPASPVTGFLRH